jgi:uncharacterized membrane protein
MLTVANMYSTRRFIARDEKTFRLLFRISLLLKAAFSLLEIVGGTLAYFISQQYLLRLVTMATQEELTEDPRDFVAQFLVQSAQQLSVSSQHFAAFYLLSHGIIKTVLIVGLLRERLSYYPLSMLVFGIFVAYQLFRFQVTHSLWLMAITILDIVVIAMTCHEYQFLRRSIRTPTKA